MTETERNEKIDAIYWEYDPKGRCISSLESSVMPSDIETASDWTVLAIRRSREPIQPSNPA